MLYCVIETGRMRKNYCHYDLLNQSVHPNHASSKRTLLFVCVSYLFRAFRIDVFVYYTNQIHHICYIYTVRTLLRCVLVKIYRRQRALCANIKSSCQCRPVVCSAVGISCVGLNS